LLGVWCDTSLLVAEIVAFKVCNSLVNEPKMPANGSNDWCTPPKDICGLLDEFAWFAVGDVRSFC
jgi:hypothetical protein